MDLMCRLFICAAGGNKSCQETFPNIPKIYASEDLGMIEDVYDKLITTLNYCSM